MNEKNRVLYLVRHAKAEKFLSHLPDIDRPLTEIGISESYLIADRLYTMDEIPDYMISSSATRSISTALIFQRVLKVPDEHLIISENLYETGVNALSLFIAGLNQQYNSVMLFGHNPIFTQLAHNFDNSITHMSTASAVKFEFNAGKWSHCSYVNATKKLFLIP